MGTITLRDIPDEMMDEVKVIAKRERRSVNQQFLVVLEEGVRNVLRKTLETRESVSKGAQIEIWQMLSGVWEDKRSTKQIIDDIVSNRSKGREFDL